MKRLIVIGAGGHGRVVADAADQPVVFLDDNLELDGVVGSINQLEQIKEKGDAIIVAIGDNKIRMEILSKCENTATIIHPSAVISESATVGCGTVVFANVVINPNSTIGRGCILNTSSTVDHDCVLGDGVHISPGAHLGGNVTVGDCTWVGIGASIKHGTTLGKNVMVGAGAAVVNDVPDGVTVVGVPAKAKKL
jgi:sugar O-acyltransferase (sialic acid O-acetyltransferase NeuD family)